MAKYLRFSGKWEVAEDSTLATLLSSRPISKVESEDLLEFVSHSLDVPDLTSDLVINFGGITTCYALLIEADTVISIKIDDQSIQVGRTIGESSQLVLPACSFTSLKVSNNSGVSAHVSIQMGGA